MAQEKEQEQKQVSITDLPYEMLKSIFSHLDPVSIGRMAQVSRQMNAVSQHPMVWKEKILLDLEKNDVSPLTYNWIEKLLISGQIAPQLFDRQDVYAQFPQGHILKKILSPKAQTLYQNGFSPKQLVGFAASQIDDLKRHIDKLSVHYKPEELAGFDNGIIYALGNNIDALIKHFTTTELAGFHYSQIGTLGRYIDKLINAGFAREQVVEFHSGQTCVLGSKIDEFLGARFTPAELVGLDYIKLRYLANNIDKFLGAGFTKEQLLEFDWHKIDVLGNNIDEFLEVGFTPAELAGFDVDTIEVLTQKIDDHSNYTPQVASSEEVLADLDMVDAPVDEMMGDLAVVDDAADFQGI